MDYTFKDNLFLKDLPDQILVNPYSENNDFLYDDHLCNIFHLHGSINRFDKNESFRGVSDILFYEKPFPLLPHLFRNNLGIANKLNSY